MGYFKLKERSAILDKLAKTAKIISIIKIRLVFLRTCGEVATRES